ncbi:MAG: acyl-CoA dehydrogenase [Balneolales bacterium]|nr:acyl-CoA dehydrogenase [Balneolales bacterium]
MESLLYGLFNTMASSWPIWLGAAVFVLAAGFTGAPLLVWLAGAAIIMWGFAAPVWAWSALGIIALFFAVKPVRKYTVSNGVMKLMKALNFLPVISQTEQTAIDAGTVWVDGELFSGKPDFKRILNETYPELTAKEQAFLDNQVEKLCEITNDWEVFQNRDLSPETWEYLLKERFFGLIIPEEYGGLGFSALANSAIVAKLTSRCGPLSTTVMVPNSLGPAELLIHYGTDEQKNYYLPRLAAGDEIPCFALTEPNAGSDAGSIQSDGVVFKDKDGSIKIRFNWEKRYITLAAISTVLGLAFKLRDPDNLLGKGTDPGITCALIPTNTPGVVLGKRHDPLGVPFYNCPTNGKDVVVPADVIIGGVEGAGKGWKMLMECLAAGRGISLPASSAGGTKALLRVTGAYAAVRKQFGLPIGKFEGIEEPLARMAGYAYILEAARVYTCGALQQGAKPAVVTAIAKYSFTETFRKVVNDSMDVLGGAAISKGPKNMVAHGYMSVPISITVEGANILTRTLMIFGQGAIRCHPYALKEIQALSNNDLNAFDDAFWSHIGHVVRNMFRSVLLSVSRGRLASSPVSGPAAKYYKKMAWTSATFAFIADVAMGSMGGALKIREKLTGRFADILMWMYLGTSVLRRFEAEGRKKEDEAFLHYSMQLCFSNIQEAFEGIFKHLEVPGLNWLFRGPVSLWSRMNTIGTAPGDKLAHIVAKSVQIPGEQRDRLTPGTYIAKQDSEPAAQLEKAFMLSVQAEDVARKIKDAVKKGILPRKKPFELIKIALDKSVISQAEFNLVMRAETERAEAIRVDDFTLDEYLKTAEVAWPTLDRSAKNSVKPEIKKVTETEGTPVLS